MSEGEGQQDCCREDGAARQHAAGPELDRRFQEEDKQWNRLEAEESNLAIHLASDGSYIEKRSDLSYRLQEVEAKTEILMSKRNWNSIDINWKMNGNIHTRSIPFSTHKMKETKPKH